MNDNEELSSELREIFEQDEDGPLLLAEAMLGEDALRFVRSDLGRYLVGRADQEIKVATIALKTVYPWRWRRITHLQNKICVAERVKAWLLEAIVSGKIAMAEVENRRSERGE